MTPTGSAQIADSQPVQPTVLLILALGMFWAALIVYSLLTGH